MFSPEPQPASQPGTSHWVSAAVSLPTKPSKCCADYKKQAARCRVAMTKRACEFVQPLTFRALSGSHVIVDDYAPDNPDPIAHITFSKQ
jgi:phosphopantothenoylcysteine synthetase/decarboxylase